MTAAADPRAATTQPRQEPPAGRIAALQAVLLIALATVPFLATLRGPFFWDDAANIQFNRTLRSPDGLTSIWTDPLASFQYYPLTYSLFWVEFQLFGERPLGYHAVNLALHATNALLVWRALVAVGITASWWVAVLFAVHPIQVETVGWISEQKNLLSTLFSLLAIIAWERYIRRGKASGALLGSLAFIAALASKTVALVLPAYLFVAEAVLRRSPPWRWLPMVLLWLALGVAAGMVTTWRETATSVRAGSPADTPPLLRFDERVLVASQSLWRYVAMLLCLEPFVPIPARSVPSWSNPTALASLLGLAAVLAVAQTLAKQGRPRTLLALGFFAAQLGPTLGFFPFQFQCLSFVADHFAYFACVGFFALVCEALLDKAPWRKGLASAIVLLLVGLTAKQSALFADPERLWAVNAKVNSEAWGAYTNLADLQLKRGALHDAIMSARQAVRIEPANPMSQQILGTALASAGQPVEAERVFRQALLFSPGNPRFHHNLGNVLVQQTRWREAVEQYERAAEGAPDFPMTHYLMGNAYRALGMRHEAQRAYERALAIEPALDAAREALAELIPGDGGQSK